MDFIMPNHSTLPQLSAVQQDKATPWRWHDGPYIQSHTAHPRNPRRGKKGVHANAWHIQKLKTTANESSATMLLFLFQSFRNIHSCIIPQRYEENSNQ